MSPAGPPQEREELPTIKFDGAEIPADIQLVDVRIDLGLNVVGSATLLFAASLDDLGEAIASLGAEVAITAAGKSVFTGEVTGIEVERSDDGSLTTITALDLLNRLADHSQVAARTNVTISDVLKKLAEDRGLGSQVEATSIKYPHLFQTGSDLDYLAELAERAGLDWWCHDKKLHAKKLALGAPRVSLTADTFNRLSMRGSAKRPTSVTVSGWDRKSNQAIAGKANLQLSALGSDSALARKVAGFRSSHTQEHRTSAIPVTVGEEASVVAAAALTRAAANALRAELESPALWQVQPGDTVEVTRGGEFTGKYLVSAVEHRVVQGNATTRILTGGRPATGIGAAAGPVQLHGRTPGIITARVTNINDPENLGRVKLKFMGLDESQESEWARVLLMGAGEQTGATMLPEVNDEVLATFEDNDIRRPIVLGSLYTTKTKMPPAERSNGKWSRVTLMERFGHQILLWGGSGQEQGVTIKLKNGSEITMDHQGTRIVGKADKTTIENGQSKIEMERSGKITITGTEIQLKADSKVQVEAAGQLGVKGAQVTVEGTGKAEVKAPMSSVKGDGMLELKGGLVKIN